MAGISDFLTALKETEWDILLQVMHDLQDGTSPERLESQRQFLASLTREIDAINKKRDALGQKVENVDVLMPILDDQIRKNPCMELELFRSMLAAWRSSLKTEINETRPNGKLEKKYDTERKRDFLIQLQSISTTLGKTVSEVKRPAVKPPLPPVPVPPESLPKAR